MTVASSTRFFPFCFRSIEPKAPTSVQLHKTKEFCWIPPLFLIQKTLSRLPLLRLKAVPSMSMLVRTLKQAHRATTLSTEQSCLLNVSMHNWWSNNVSDNTLNIEQLLQHHSPGRRSSLKNEPAHGSAKCFSWLMSK